MCIRDSSQQCDLFLVGVRKNLTLVQTALDVVALGLLGKDHGYTCLLYTSDTDTDGDGTDGDSQETQKPVKKDEESIKVDFTAMQAKYPDVVGYVLSLIHI